MEKLEERVADELMSADGRVDVVDEDLVSEETLGTLAS
mgnify:CR=1 FL=1